ncbi:hypothetical protein D7030_06515 [Flavobacteriaceae bacterium AU392]|nr:hypothetical protein D1817_01905 [Flavobacteriaceae bacterium]RKM84787.1 hypothetical protein D7030_06515 [Flavobacteriaceae bacterium AU392]
MKMQNKTKIALILFVLISFASYAAVQPPPPPPPPGFPIDGGVLFALAIGVLYGVKKKFNQ